MHYVRGMSDLTAKVPHNGLVTETNAEYRQFILEVIQSGKGDTGFVGSTGTGRQKQQIGSELGGDFYDLIQRCICTVDLCETITLAELVDEVISKRIEVVYE